MAALKPQLPVPVTWHCTVALRKQHIPVIPQFKSAQDHSTKLCIGILCAKALSNPCPFWYAPFFYTKVPFHIVQKQFHSVVHDSRFSCWPSTRVQASHPLKKHKLTQAGSGPGQAKSEECLPTVWNSWNGDHFEKIPLSRRSQYQKITLFVSRTMNWIPAYSSR